MIFRMIATGAKPCLRTWFCTVLCLHLLRPAQPAQGHGSIGLENGGSTICERNVVVILGTRILGNLSLLFSGF